MTVNILLKKARGKLENVKTLLLCVPLLIALGITEVTKASDVIYVRNPKTSKATSVIVYGLPQGYSAESIADKVLEKLKSEAAAQEPLDIQIYRELLPVYTAEVINPDYALMLTIH